MAEQVFTIEQAIEEVEEWKSESGEIETMKLLMRGHGFRITYEEYLDWKNRFAAQKTPSEDQFIILYFGLEASVPGIQPVVCAYFVDYAKGDERRTFTVDDLVRKSLDCSEDLGFGVGAIPEFNNEEWQLAIEALARWHIYADVWCGLVTKSGNSVRAIRIPFSDWARLYEENNKAVERKDGITVLFGLEKKAGLPDNIETTTTRNTKDLELGGDFHIDMFSCIRMQEMTVFSLKLLQVTWPWPPFPFQVPFADFCDRKVS